MLLPLMKPRLGDSVDGYVDFFKKLMLNMAEWKDKQFKEYLEQKLISYLAYSGSDVVNIQNMGARAAINELINELFNADNQVG